jgi:hypothetical protein
LSVRAAAGLRDTAALRSRLDAAAAGVIFSDKKFAGRKVKIVKRLMLKLFRKSVSASDFAEVMWDGCSGWPAKHGGDLKEKFTFEKDISLVFDEVVYYLSFATDYAFYCQLEGKPQIEKAVRDAFGIHLARFAREHQCKPVPPGQWMDDSLIWMETGVVSTVVGNPLTNLKKRFALYAQSLERRNDRSAGERTAHLLASWCGCSFNSIFILYAMPLFLGEWKAVKDTLDSFSVKSWVYLVF